MCLYVDKVATDLYYQDNKHKKTVTIYKFLRYNIFYKEYQTPYQNVVIKNQILRASRPIKTYIELKRKRPHYHEINGGCIHAIKSLRDARESYMNFNYDCVRCEANMKDFVAVGLNGDIAFTKIKLPKKAVL